MVHTYAQLQLTYALWLAPGGLKLSSSTLCRIILVKISCTGSPYSELQLMSKLHLRGAQPSPPMLYRETQGNGWKNRLISKHMQINTILWSLVMVCRRAQISMKDNVHPQHDPETTTWIYKKCCRHCQTSKFLNQLLPQTRIEKTVIESKWYATVTVTYCWRNSLQNELSSSVSTAKDDHQW